MGYTANPRDFIHENDRKALDALKQELEDHPQRFSSWFLIAAPRVLAMVGGV